MVSRTILRVSVDEKLKRYLPETLVRFGYLHPSVDVVISSATEFDEKVTSQDNLVRDFQLILYRQKIYEESKDFRAEIIRRVLG